MNDMKTKGIQETFPPELRKVYSIAVLATGKLAVHISNSATALRENKVRNAGSAMKEARDSFNELARRHGLEIMTGKDVQKLTLQAAARQENTTAANAFKKYGRVLREAAKAAGFTGFLTAADFAPVSSVKAPRLGSTAVNAAQTIALVDQAVGLQLFAIAAREAGETERVMKESRQTELQRKQLAEDKKAAAARSAAERKRTKGQKELEKLLGEGRKLTAAIPAPAAPRAGNPVGVTPRIRKAPEEREFGTPPPFGGGVAAMAAPAAIVKTAKLKPQQVEARMKAIEKKLVSYGMPATRAKAIITAVRTGRKQTLASRALPVIRKAVKILREELAKLKAEARKPGGKKAG